MKGKVNKMAENEKTVSWEIKEHLAVLRENTSGWKRELNIVSWNDGPARFDIREWNEDHTRMTRGVTMSMDEGKKICDMMHNYLKRAKEHEVKEHKEQGYER